MIVQIVSTGEALMARRLDAIEAGEHEDLRVDLAPREYVIEYLREAFPTELRRVCEDENGAPCTEIVRDADGRVVESRAACALRDAMIEGLYLLDPVQTALDQIVWRLGPDAVAEAARRGRRIVPVGTGDARRLRVERRAASASLAETKAFMEVISTIKPPFWDYSGDRPGSPQEGPRRLRRAVTRAAERTACCSKTCPP